MTLEELRARLAEVVAEMRSLAEIPIDDLTDEQNTRFDELEAESTELRAKVETETRRHEAIRAAAEAGHVETTDPPQQMRRQGDPYDVSTLRFDTSAGDLVARANTAIEGDDWLPDAHKERATQVLRRIDRPAALARMMLATGHPSYRTAFAKIMSNRTWALDDVERSALIRAQSLTDGSGGFAVPFTLDPTILLTNDGSINPMRQIARIVQTMTDSWNGVTSTGATATYSAEAAQATDDSIALVQPSIPVHRLDVFIPYSIEIGMDWAGIEDDLRNVMMDARDNRQALAHFTGTGTNEPTGIITELAGGASIVTPGTAETFAQADVFNLRRQLPRRYRRTNQQPSWVANTGTYDDIRQFDTGGGGGFWSDMTDGTPDRLLGVSTYEASAMDDSQDINAAATANNHVLLVGDFSRYVIVDRIGMFVENIPHLFGTANNRPTGQRGLYAFSRDGGESVDDNAFRLLNVATTA